MSGKHSLTWLYVLNYFVCFFGNGKNREKEQSALIKNTIL